MEKKKKDKIIIISIIIFTAIIISIVVRSTIMKFKEISPSSEVQVKFQPKMATKEKAKIISNSDKIDEAVRTVNQGNNETRTQEVNIGFNKTFKKKEKTESTTDNNINEEIGDKNRDANNDEISTHNSNLIKKKLNISNVSTTNSKPQPKKKKEPSEESATELSREELLKKRKLELEKGYDIISNSNDNSLTLSTVVYGNQILINGDNIKLRTIKETTYNDIIIPKNTVIYARINIVKNRALCSINNIQIGNKTITTHLVGYGFDNGTGIPLAIDETKEIVTDEIDKAVKSEINSSSVIVGGYDVGGIISGIGNSLTRSKKKTKIQFLDSSKVTFKTEKKK